MTIDDRHASPLAPGSSVARPEEVPGRAAPSSAERAWLKEPHEAARLGEYLVRTLQHVDRLQKLAIPAPEEAQGES